MIVFRAYLVLFLLGSTITVPDSNGPYETVKQCQHRLDEMAKYALQIKGLPLLAMRGKCKKEHFA